MKFQIQRNALNEALNITSKAVNPNTIIPILSSFLFRIKDNECEICASGTDVFISKRIEVIAKGTACIAIPATRLANLIKDLPGQLLDFTVGETSVVIKSASGKYTIPYENGNDFPVMKIEDNPVKIIVSGADLIGCLNKTTFAASVDALRNLNSIHVELSKGRIDFTATDANVLSSIGFEVENEVPVKIIIPIKSCLLVQGLTLDKDVAISVYKNNIEFRADDLVIQSVLISEKYPDYKAVIPVNNDKLVVVNRTQLLSSVKRVVQFSNNITSLIRIDISQNKISVSSENEMSENANEELTADYNGDGMAIGFNGKFLLTCLQKNNNENVYMSLLAPNRAMTIRTDDVEQNTQDLMLIMPCMLLEKVNASV